MDTQSLFPSYFVDLVTGKIHHARGKCSRFKFFPTLDEARKAGFKEKCPECLKDPFAVPDALIHFEENRENTGSVVVKKREPDPGEIVIQHIPDRTYLKGTIVHKRILEGEKVSQRIIPKRSVSKGMARHNIKIK